MRILQGYWKISDASYPISEDRFSDDAKEDAERFIEKYSMKIFVNSVR